VKTPQDNRPLPAWLDLTKASRVVSDARADFAHELKRTFPIGCMVEYRVYPDDDAASPSYDVRSGYVWGYLDGNLLTHLGREPEPRVCAVISWRRVVAMHPPLPLPAPKGGAAWN